MLDGRREEVQLSDPDLLSAGIQSFTVWQASRRHYRMNQTMECRTYYMAYEGTAQAKVIELIAEKQVATAAIQESSPWKEFLPWQRVSMRGLHWHQAWRIRM